MRAPIGLFIVVLSSFFVFGCTKNSSQDLSLVVPKGYPAATKIVSTSWEDQLKQKLALGEAAMAEQTRIPYKAAANAPQIAEGKRLSRWFAPLLLSHAAPTATKPATTAPAGKKILASTARAHHWRRAISCKNCRAHKSRSGAHAHMLAKR